MSTSRSSISDAGDDTHRRTRWNGSIEFSLSIAHRIDRAQRCACTQSGRPLCPRAKEIEKGNELMGWKKKSIDSQARGRSQPNWEVFRQKKKEIYAAESPLYIYSKGLLCVISQPDMVRAVLCACCVGWVRDHFTDDWTCVLGRTNDKSFPTKTFFFHSSCLTFFCVCWL